MTKLLLIPLLLATLLLVGCQTAPPTNLKANNNIWRKFSEMKGYELVSSKDFVKGIDQKDREPKITADLNGDKIDESIVLMINRSTKNAGAFLIITEKDQNIKFKTLRCKEKGFLFMGIGYLPESMPTSLSEIIDRLKPSHKIKADIWTYDENRVQTNIQNGL